MVGRRETSATRSSARFRMWALTGERVKPRSKEEGWEAG